MCSVEGNCGASLAGNLSASKAKPSVLLIEAGGENAKDNLRIAGERFLNVYKNPELRFDYRTTPQSALDGRVLPYLRGKGLGGSSIANHLTYTRGSSEDYDLWAEIVGDNAWKWDQVLEHYKSLENLHLQDDQSKYSLIQPCADKHGYSGPVDITVPSMKEWLQGMDIVMDAAKEFGHCMNLDNNSGNPMGMGVCYTTAHNGFRTTSATAYLRKAPSNLTIWTSSTVTELVFGDRLASRTPKVIGIRLKDGREASATKEVILSAGAIDTPKLLLLNGIGPALELAELGIKPVLNAPAVGKNLSDHCYTVMSWISDDKISDAAAFNCSETGMKAAQEQWLRDRTGPMATRNLPNIIGFLKLDPDRYPSKELELFDDSTRSYLQKPTVPQYEIFFNGPPPLGLRVYDGEDYFDVGVGMLPPQSRGSVTFASKDPDVPALIASRFLTHPYDRRTFVDAIRECLRFMNSPAVARHLKRPLCVPKSESDDDIMAFLRENLLSVLHACGTVKMGKDDDPTACVDTDFCFRGLRGLRVVDLSVAPVLTK